MHDAKDTANTNTCCSGRVVSSHDDEAFVVSAALRAEQQRNRRLEVQLAALIQWGLDGGLSPEDVTPLLSEEVEQLVWELALEGGAL